MEDIGKILSDKRKTLNKSIDDIHDETRVSADHLRFLEQNNFSFLPETYVKSFLKTYASSLGLDPEEILNAYRGRSRGADSGKPEKTVALQFDFGDKKQPEDEEVSQANRASKAATPKSIRAESSPGISGPKSILEWLLFSGTCLLLLLIVAAFMKFRETTHVSEGPQQRNLHVAERYQNLAEISMQEISPPHDLNVEPPLELQITALGDIALRLGIDRAESAMYRLSAKQRRVWIARDRFEFTLSQVVPGSAQLRTQGADSTVVLNFAFSRENLKEDDEHAK